MSEAIDIETAKRLGSFVERIERLDDEIAAMNGDKRDVYKEAKDAGFDTKILKSVIRDRAQDPVALREGREIYDLYNAALEAAGLKERGAREVMDVASGEVTETDGADALTERMPARQRAEARKRRDKDGDGANDPKAGRETKH